MSERFERTRQAKDPDLERGLELINGRLEGLLEVDAVPERPILFIVGHQRCGATVVGQYLAAALAVGYPSNLIARFWRAPLAGLVIQRGLQAQLAALRPNFSSELGSTPGVLDPHEFSYFWEHWFPLVRSCRDPAGFVRLLGSLQAAFDLPLLFKNVFNSLRIDLLAELLPPARFLWVERDAGEVARSTLEARRSRFGRDDAWFGVRGDDWDDLAALPPTEQIAAQIARTEEAMRAGWDRVAPEARMTVDYHQFCAAPARVAAELQSRWGLAPRPGVALPASFTASRRR